MFKLGPHQNTQSQEKKMENQEILKAIATLADKVSRYHERLLAVEREKEEDIRRDVKIFAPKLADMIAPAKKT